MIVVLTEGSMNHRPSRDRGAIHGKVIASATRMLAMIVK
jgi:hypothetical protein